MSKTIHQIAYEICDDVIAGITIRKACKKRNINHIDFWKLLQKDDKVYQTYKRARELAMYGVADELLDLTDAPVEICRNSGVIIQHRKMMVDTRKWLLERELPKVYSDRFSNFEQSIEIEV